MKELDRSLVDGHYASSDQAERASKLTRQLVAFLGRAAALQDPTIEGFTQDFIDTAVRVGNLAGDIERMSANSRKYGDGWSTYLDTTLTKLEMVARLLLPAAD